MMLGVGFREDRALLEELFLICLLSLPCTFFLSPSELCPTAVGCGGAVSGVWAHTDTVILC